MSDPALAHVLDRYLARSLYSRAQLAALSGVPKTTIANWLSGRIRRPHHWQPLLRVAAALRLSQQETDALLAAGMHASLAELQQLSHSATERQLLAAWPVSPGEPFQAIADLPYFVGRQTEISLLGQALRDRRQSAICSVQGMGGVGKTCLAARVAYQLRSDFPDGVLWARLDRNNSMAILSQFAAAFGVDVSQHVTLESRSALVRGLLANKRVLIVLDNAEQSAQLQPLLPPSTGRCAVLVTTRYDLAALDGWMHLELQPFSADAPEIAMLFERLLGPERSLRCSSQLYELAGLVGQLPLALAILAGRLARSADPGLLEQLLEQLRQRNATLDGLQREQHSVRHAFDLSYQALQAGQQRILRYLSIFHGADFDLAAAAVVCELPAARLAHEIEHLRRHSLIQTGRAGRYRLHPLLRLYTSERMGAEAAAEYLPALERMVRYYQHLASQPLVARDELANIQAALQVAADAGPVALLVSALQSCFERLHEHGLWAFAERLVEQGLARLCGSHNFAARAELYNLRGQARWWQGLDPVESHQQALELARQSGAAAAESEALRCLGNYAWRQGQIDQAEQYHLAALAIAQRLGDQVAQARLLSNLGATAQLRQRQLEASNYLQASLQIARASQQLRIQVVAGQNLGWLHASAGNYQLAGHYFAQAAELARRHHLDVALMGLLGDWGIQARLHDRLAEAESYLQEALQIARHLQRPAHISTFLAELAEVARLRGQLQHARELLDTALVAETRPSQARLLALIRRARLAVTQAELALLGPLLEEMIGYADTIQEPGRQELATLHAELLAAGVPEAELLEQLAHPNEAV